MVVFVDSRAFDHCHAVCRHSVRKGRSGVGYRQVAAGGAGASHFGVELQVVGVCALPHVVDAVPDEERARLQADGVCALQVRPVAVASQSSLACCEENSSAYPAPMSRGVTVNAAPWPCAAVSYSPVAPLYSWFADASVHSPVWLLPCAFCACQCRCVWLVLLPDYAEPDECVEDAVVVYGWCHVVGGGLHVGACVAHGHADACAADD